MIQRLLARLERMPIGPLEGFLIFFAWIMVRLQTEAVFLDPDRSFDFFVYNVWYFSSILLSMILLLVWLAAVPADRAARAALSFSAVILVPLLDLFFYSHLQQKDLLTLYMLPIFLDWGEYAHYLTVHVIGHEFLVDATMSLGMRLEVWFASLGVGVYVFLQAEGRWRRWIAAPIAYLVCLCTIYVHAIGVVHPFTCRWIFTLLVCVELLLLLARWDAPALRALVKRWAWKETGLLVAAAIAGFVVRQAMTKPERPAFGEPLVAIVSLAALGLWIGYGRSRVDEQGPGAAPTRADRWIALVPILSLAAGYLVAPGFLLALAMLWGLAYLAWFSPWRLSANTAVFSLMAGLALWVTVWAGGAIRGLPPRIDPALMTRPPDTVGEGPDAKPFSTRWLVHPAWLALPALVFVGTWTGRRRWRVGPQPAPQSAPDLAGSNGREPIPAETDREEQEEPTPHAG